MGGAAESASVRVRPAGPEDRAGIDVVEAAAFGSHADVVLPLVRELRRTDAVSFELVAELGSELVGHVAVSRGWLDAPRRLVVVLVLSPLGVRSPHQRRGIGGALIRAAAARAAAEVPVLVLEGDPAYYSRHGFVRASGIGIRAPSDRIPDAAFQVLLLPDHEAWMTGTIVYPDAFWSLDAVGLR